MTRGRTAAEKIVSRLAGRDVEAGNPVVCQVDAVMAQDASHLQNSMRRFAETCGARLFDIGSGLSHVMMPEAGLALPGTLVLGSDSPGGFG